MHALRANDEPVSAACGVAGHALVESPLGDIGSLRDLPAPAGSGPLPARFLRHADEQTVVAMRAVLEAIAGGRSAAAAKTEGDVSGYGVVAASCQAGRIAAARSLTMLRSGGPVTVSPHIVPQCSLHSIAGAVSVALGMHGPNVGVGGGPHALGEGLLASLTLLAATGAPGIWFVATAWDGEPTVAADGTPAEHAADPPVCVAFAVALLPEASAAPTANRLVLRGPAATTATGPTPPRQRPSDRRPADAIRRFAAAVREDAAAAARWSLSLPGAGDLRLVAAPAAGRLREAA